jgi:hypothetical protein
MHTIIYYYSFHNVKYFLRLGLTDAHVLQKLLVKLNSKYAINLV